MKKIRVWDLPLRLFHWSLVILIVAAVLTEDADAMEWHFRVGYAVLTLVAFRILWGLIGPRYARFTSFIYRPSAIIAYLRGGKQGKQPPTPGHNPLGGLSVIALLAVVLAQAISGLFSNDDIIYEGPLAQFVSKTLSDQLTWFHAEVNITLIYILVALHVLAIAFYWIVKKRNLVTPMITGDQLVESDVPAARDSWRVRLLALVLFAGCAAVVYYIANLPSQGG